ncbi:MAG: aromatic ring-hydroxylating oxygenase subunit alpha [Acidimicrobiales bacterium]
MAGQRIASRGDGTRYVWRDTPKVPPIGPTKVDAAIYTSPQQWERERETVFRSTWFVVDRSDRLARPGDFLVWEEFGETVVIARTEGDDLVAWHNVCQHRGARVVDPLRVTLENRTGRPHTPLAAVDAPKELSERDGTGPVAGTCARGEFVCPWHGFRYGLDGVVMAVPERGDFAPDDLTGLRAPAVAVRDLAGWIWVNLSGDRAEPLEEYLGPTILEEFSHHRMEDMVCLDRREYVMPTNWKAVVDGFIEVYHLPETHRETIGDRLACRDTVQHLMHRHSMYFVPSSANLDAYYEHGDHIRDSISHYLVFPNSIFNCNATHIQAFQPVPIDATTTKYNVFLLVQPGGDDAFIEDQWRKWDHFQKVAKEDLYAATQLGATVRSMGYARNLMNAREVRIPHFLDTIRSYTHPGEPGILTAMHR